MQDDSERCKVRHRDGPVVIRGQYRVQPTRGISDDRRYFVHWAGQCRDQCGDWIIRLAKKYGRFPLPEEEEHYEKRCWQILDKKGIDATVHLAVNPQAGRVSIRIQPAPGTTWGEAYATNWAAPSLPETAYS